MIFFAPLPKVFLLVVAAAAVWMPQQVLAGGGGSDSSSDDGHGGGGRHHKGGFRGVDLSTSTPHDDIRVVVDVVGIDNATTELANSYSVGNQCYCMGTLGNDLDKYPVETPLGWMTVADVCAEMGEGPGPDGHPQYNDVQCGNGPPNIALDEHLCPGRVDIGDDGCGYIGPKWDIGRAYMANQLEYCRETEGMDCKYMFFFEGKTMYKQKTFSRRGMEKMACHSECVSTYEMYWAIRSGWTCGSCPQHDNDE